MAAQRPRRVRIVEVGPRDGLQNEPAAIPTNVKVRYVDLLSEAGFNWIEVTSFVHPRAVPQMADADEVFRAIGKKPGVRYAALVPNPRGLDRALAAGGGENGPFLAPPANLSPARTHRALQLAPPGA